MSLTEVLTDALHRVHFSDEESDRLITLDVSEVIAVVRQIEPAIEKLIAEQYDAGLRRGSKRVIDAYNEALFAGRL